MTGPKTRLFFLIILSTLLLRPLLLKSFYYLLYEPTPRVEDTPPTTVSPKPASPQTEIETETARKMLEGDEQYVEEEEGTLEGEDAVNKACEHDGIGQVGNAQNHKIIGQSEYQIYDVFEGGEKEEADGPREKGTVQTNENLHLPSEDNDFISTED